MIDPNLKNARILIVDDQKANIDVLEELLRMQEYTNYISTVDPREVLHLFNSFKPDLILLDLMMPYLSGYDVMEQLRNVIAPDSFLPILVLTADISIDAKQRALSEGAKDFLVKPFDLIEVGLRIRNLLETRYLYQQYENRNRVLDEKVRDRTIKLEQANKQMIKALDKAEESDRLKTCFMQNISHEVRTPLNSIMGFSTLLTDPDLEAELKKRFLPLLQNSINRLINTITDYMDISLIASGNMEVRMRDIDLKGEFYRLKNKFDPFFLTKELEFTIDVPEQSDDLVIYNDPEHLQKILSHLLENALKFTHKGSVSMGYSLGSGKVEIWIRDTGIGISEESQERIFEIFMQEDLSNTRGYEGSGLGLAVIRGLLKLMGGEIRVKSVKGSGSTFSFTLPADVTEVAAPAEREHKPSESLQTKPVILIADDEISNLIYLETILTKEASVLLKAINGKEAVDICQAHPEISCVLMDIKMPIMNGFEATTAIKSFRKDITVIGVSAYAMSGDERKGQEAGCDDYLPKPFTKKEILGKLRKHGLIG